MGGTAKKLRPVYDEVVLDFTDAIDVAKCFLSNLLFKVGVNVAFDHDFATRTKVEFVFQQMGVVAKRNFKHLVDVFRLR